MQVMTAKLSSCRGGTEKDQIGTQLGNKQSGLFFSRFFFTHFTPVSVSGFSKGERARPIIFLPHRRKIIR